ncbi:MAG: helix-turn-helix transcriptional regulator [Selenomonadaceae bacterium]|nr:helix-turn-helix transcriptional regulator [Selenomonadaceae bacterium]
MELKDRIKKARKDAGYKSRDALAVFLGSTRYTIEAYEMGRVLPNDVFLQLMAAKLHISYDWLKFGNGEMNDTPANDLSILLDDDTLTEADKEIMKIYIALPPEHRQIIKDFAVKVAAAENAEKQTPPASVVEEPKIYEIKVTEEELKKLEADRHSQEAEKKSRKWRMS